MKKPCLHQNGENEPRTGKLDKLLDARKWRPLPMASNSPRARPCSTGWNHLDQPGDIQSIPPSRLFLSSFLCGAQDGAGLLAARLLRGRGLHSLMRLIPVGRAAEETRECHPDRQAMDRRRGLMVHAIRLECELPRLGLAPLSATGP